MVINHFKETFHPQSNKIIVIRGTDYYYSYLDITATTTKSSQTNWTTSDLNSWIIIYYRRNVKKNRTYQMTATAAAGMGFKPKFWIIYWKVRDHGLARWCNQMGNLHSFERLEFGREKSNKLNNIATWNDNALPNWDYKFIVNYLRWSPTM